MQASERREQVLDAALHEFALHGYDGTSTDDVAKAAGISQPYLFRLFETKRALFVELVRRCFERVGEGFTAAADGLTGESALKAMGDRYLEMVGDRDLLLLQLHAYAACEDPEVREATRRVFGALWQHVADIAEVPLEDVVDFFAHGLLLTVIVAMDATELHVGWVRACFAERDGR